MAYKLNISLLVALSLLSAVGSAQQNYFPFKNDQGKWGFKDMIEDKIVIPARYDEAGYSFKSGLCWVKLDNKYGFINGKGEMVVPAEYDFASDFSNGLALVNKGRRVSENIEDYIPGKYGFIDSTGKLVVPLQYSRAENFNDGMALVEINDKIGFIDTTGKLVIPAIYYVGGLYFVDGKVEVEDEEARSFFIDKTGKEIKEQD